VEGCGQRTTHNKVQVGGGLRVDMLCYAGHKRTWESVEFFNKVNVVFSFGLHR